MNTEVTKRTTVLNFKHQKTRSHIKKIIGFNFFF